jgi:hypothetical protein
VLATVAMTVYKFYEANPGCYVFVTGSTKTRTRLYRIGISKRLTEIRKDFNVYGLLSGKWQDFSEGVDYEGFMVKMKEK